MNVFKGIKIRTFVIFACAALSGAALFHTSQQVQEAQDRLAQINADIAHEQNTMRILRAEWEYLNRPERLEALAEEFMDLAPARPDKIDNTMIEEASALPNAVQDPVMVDAPSITRATYNTGNTGDADQTEGAQ